MMRIHLPTPRRSCNKLPDASRVCASLPPPPHTHTHSLSHPRIHVMLVFAWVIHQHVVIFVIHCSCLCCCYQALVAAGRLDEATELLARAVDLVSKHLAMVKLSKLSSSLGESKGLLQARRDGLKLLECYILVEAGDKGKALKELKPLLKRWVQGWTQRLVWACASMGWFGTASGFLPGLHFPSSALLQSPTFPTSLSLLVNHACVCPFPPAVPLLLLFPFLPFPPGLVRAGGPAAGRCGVCLPSWPLPSCPAGSGCGMWPPQPPSTPPVHPWRCWPLTGLCWGSSTMMPPLGMPRC
jgi:hypothetical protein